MSLNTPNHGRIAVVCAVLLLAATQVYAQQELSWQQLEKVEYAKEEGGTRWLPRFDESIKKLDRQDVTLQGFMLPLQQSMEQTHFILSAFPTTGCSFCMPGGPQALMEVKASKAVAFNYEAITMRGTLELLKDDPDGLLYRLTDARAVQ